MHYFCGNKRGLETTGGIPIDGGFLKIGVSID